MPDSTDQTQGSQGQAQSAAGTNPQGQQSQGQQQQGQEPKWLSYVPEAERKEARDGWMMQSDYTKKTSEFSEQKKAWEAERKQFQDNLAQYDAFWKQNRPTWDLV